MRTRWFTSSLAGAAGLALLAASGCGEQAAAITVGDSYVSQSDFMDEVRDRHELQEASAAAEAEALSDPADESTDADDPDDGSYPQDLVGETATERVIYMVTVAFAEQEGLEVTEEDEQAACSLQTGGGALAGGDPCEQFLDLSGLSDVSEETQERTVELNATWYVLEGEYIPEHLVGLTEADVSELPPEELEELQGELDEALGEMQDDWLTVAEGMDITINSKYGTWDDEAFATYLVGQTQELPVVPPEGPLVQVDGDDEDASEARIDPELLETLGISLADLAEEELTQLEQMLESMGMDPTDLTSEEIEQFLLTMQMGMGLDQPGAVPAP